MSVFVVFRWKNKEGCIVDVTSSHLTIGMPNELKIRKQYLNTIISAIFKSTKSLKI